MKTNNKLLMIQNGFIYRYVDGKYTGEKAQIDNSAEVTYTELDAALRQFLFHGLTDSPDAA